MPVFKPFGMNVRGVLKEFSAPVVMGILNITPDSFYDGGKWSNVAGALKATEKMLGEGAGIIDVGGQSTRPGSDRIDAGEEMKRVRPVMEALIREFPEAIFSIDTYYGKVAEACLDIGAAIVNDISAGSFDPGVIEISARAGVPYVLTHMKGTPKDIHLRPPGDQPIVEELISFFTLHLWNLRSAGIRDVILDPGFGFGKTLQQNFELLGRLDEFGFLNLPVLAGISRKKMIRNALNIEVADSLNATTAAHMIALENGASILRVHDVREAREAVRIYMLTRH